MRIVEKKTQHDIYLLSTVHCTECIERYEQYNQQQKQKQSIRSLHCIAKRHK